MSRKWDAVADLIVVGAGAAGSTLAGRLAQESDDSVLLLEAGDDDRSFWLELPAGVGKILIGRRAVRRYFTRPETGLGNRRIYWPRGETVGGSGRINGMVWVHGDPREYDRWESQGNEGWGSTTMLPTLRAIERYAATESGNRGHAGPIVVTEYSPRDPLSASFIAAAEAVGMHVARDYNDGSYRGAGMLQHNTRRGFRFDASAAILKPARRRRNLRVQTRTRVVRILLDGSRAVGVEVLHDGRLQAIRAGREVILCAGAVASPGILERSGIGARAALATAGIAQVMELPGVGQNLQDHFHVRINLAARGVTTLNDIMHSMTARARAAARFALRRDGLLACATCTAHALVASGEEGGRADAKLQLHHLTSVDSRDPDRYVLDRHSGFSIGVFQLRPESRGSVHVESPDPLADPAIVARYLDTELDRAVTVRALQLARRVAAAPPLARFVTSELRPGASVADASALLEYARATGTTSYHPAGTCRMGRDAGAVVDASLRVHGTHGLRVADASVMPTLPSSNTHAPCIAIGWRAADLVLSSYRNP